MLRRLRNFASASTKAVPQSGRSIWTASRWGDGKTARQLTFDFSKLCDKAISCSPGASVIVECLKLEGGFNRAFNLRLDNGTSLVARVPFSVAGPAQLVTNSEIATLEYGQWC